MFISVLFIKCIKLWELVRVTEVLRIACLQSRQSGQRVRLGNLVRVSVLKETSPISVPTPYRTIGTVLNPESVFREVLTWTLLPVSPTVSLFSICSKICGDNVTWDTERVLIALHLVAESESG